MDTDTLYSELESALAAVGATSGASQAHGLLCGMLCVQADLDQAPWMAQVLENTAPRGEEAQAVLALLTRLFEDGKAALESPEATFEPLLPEEDAPVSERASALAGWCEGFLLGLSLAGLPAQKDLGGDVNELLRDFTEITQVEPDPDSEEANESAYTELVEYVRVATLVILESLRPGSGTRERKEGEGSIKGKRTLH
jgi:yecA family protein